MKKIDPITLLLSGMVILYTFIIIWIAVFLKTDGQTFQIVSNLASGFAGALLIRINPSRTQPDADAAVKRISDIHTESQTPLEKKDGK